MPEAMRKITPADILAPAEYEQQRKALKAELIPVKKQRRIEVGPFATLYFENYHTMWLQVQEMLRIEKIFEEDGIQHELESYVPLVPTGSNAASRLLLAGAPRLVRSRPATSKATVAPAAAVVGWLVTFTACRAKSGASLGFAFR